MIMFSIIQLGFTRFLTDRKEWIYLPPLRYMCVWCVVGVPDIGGEYFGFLVAILDFAAQKNETLPLRICPSARLTTAPDRLDWVHKWVQQSGLIPI